MANKIVVLAVSLATLIVLTQATFQTTVITTEIDTETDLGRCGEEYPEQCEKFMKRGSSGRGLFDKCCDELKEMDDPQCQCDSMKMMMKEMGSSMRGGGSQQFMMMEKAMMMPMMCGTMERKCSMSTM